MNDTVTHTNHRSPLDLRVLLTNGVGYVRGCFTKQRQIVQSSVVSKAVGDERILAQAIRIGQNFFRQI